MKKFIILLISICLLTGCGKNKDIKIVDHSDDKSQEKVEVINLVDTLSLEINSEVNLYNLIEEDNGKEIISEDYVIDTSKLGEQELVIKYKENDEEKEYSFNIKVIDTKKPEIKYTKELTTSIGKNIDLLTSVTVTDNSKEKITPTIEGNYDFNKDGVYHLKYIAIDSSGNKKEEDFTLIVKKLSISTTIEPIDNSSSNNSESNNKNNSNNVQVSHDINDYLYSATRQYKVNYNYGFVKSTTDFVADNRQEVMDIMYSALNEGADKFGFYCNYETCIDDVKTLGNDGTLAYIQDYVHPYNTFSEYKYQFSGKNVTITGTKRYSNNDIIALENKVTKVISSMNSSMNTFEKIKYVHDYVVNNSSYEVGEDMSFHSAVGTLLNGKSVCEGYTHAMSIFLNKLGIPNYRVSVTGLHTWNLIYVDGKWKHLDATWDDPIYTNNGVREETLRHDFFLIDSLLLKKLDSNGMHAFNQNIYMEA